MQCISPTLLKRHRTTSESYYYQKVDCSKCVACRKKRSNQWSFRLKQEYKDSLSAVFLTLTYEDTLLPFTENGLMTINMKHHQAFMKRLRKRISKENLVTTNPLKYYAIGEYGSNTHRPHYHSILFNLPKNFIDNDKLYTIWQKGNVHIGDVNSKSIAYVTGYLQKSIVDNERDKLDDRVREKNNMSKGLGLSYITDGKIRYYKNHLNPYIRHTDGQKLSMPRYYRDKIYTEEERNILAQKGANFQPEITDYKKDFELKKDAVRKQEKKNRLKRNKI